MRLALVPAAVALVLGACTQTASTDPCAGANAPVTFGNLLSNSMSGSYGQCIDTMSEELAVERLRGRAFENKAADLRAEERRLSGERQAAARRLREMNEQQAAMMEELSQLQTARNVDQQRAEALIEEQRRLNDDLERLNTRDSGASAAEAAALRERQQRALGRMRATLG
jgi:chromosome segregation ATPase